MTQMTNSSLSKWYKRIRTNAISATYGIQSFTQHHQDLESVINYGDKALKLLLSVSKNRFKRDIPSGIGAKLYDLSFPSPLTIAAFKDDLDIIKFWLDLGMGGACFKTIMALPRTGNPRPRIQSVHIDGDHAVINAMGLPGKGISGFCESLLDHPIMKDDKPLGVSIGGTSLDEYTANFKLIDHFLNEHRKSTYVEINISCPNTHDGQDMLKNPSLLADLLTRIRSVSDRIVGVKLSPDQTNDALKEMADITANYSRTYLNLGNTTYRKTVDVGLKDGAISIGGGGLSGPPLFDRTCEMLRHIKPVGLPIISTGGITKKEDAYAILNEGATLVGMATGLILDPFEIPAINAYLKETQSK